jgi:hypothetical protein
VGGIKVEHGHSVVRHELREEAPLGGEIGVEVAVKVEVVMRQVGEDGGGEAHAGHAILLQGVRGDLHGDGIATRLRAARQQGVKGFRGRRRQAGREDFLADLVADGAQRDDLAPGGAQHRGHQQHRRRLPDGYRDAMKLEAF